MIVPQSSQVPSWIIPGARGLFVEGRRHKEVIFLWPVSGEAWVTTGPEDLDYVERVAEMPGLVDITGAVDYPADVEEVFAFEDSLEPDEMVTLIKRGRVKAMAERTDTTFDDSGLRAVNWEGQPLAVPTPGRLAAARHRLVGKAPLHGRSLNRVPAAANQSERRVRPTPTSHGVEVASLQAPAGKAWVIMDTEFVSSAANGHAFGDELKSLGGRSLIHGDLAVGEVEKGVFALCRLLDVVEVAPALVRAAEAVGTKPGEAEAEEEKGDGEYDGDDARTLWVSTVPDAQQHDGHYRFKTWQAACEESYQEGYPARALTGKPEALHVCRKFLLDHNRPTLWLASFAQRKNLDEDNKVYHELSVLVDIIQKAGEYDQLNLGGNL